MHAETPDADHGTPPLPGLQRLLAVIDRLRAPDGCPWDRQQTGPSLAPYLIEEAFEAADALRRNDPAEATEELGDVLVNVALLGHVLAGASAAGVDRAAASAADKLVRRHPHVFGGPGGGPADPAFAGWEQQKRAEQQAKGRPAGALAGVPVALPALLRAQRVGDKAAKVGFDWPDATGPRQKIDEELRELDAAIQGGAPERIAAEFGDVLFSLCNLARHLGVTAEVALAGTIDTFARRFAHVERHFAGDLQGRTLDELDAAWRAAKALEAADGRPTA